MLGSASDRLPGLDGASVHSVDTPRTEDFEQAFQINLVKQVAGVAVSNFPGAESENDTIDSNYIKQKLRQSGKFVASRESNYRPLQCISPNQMHFPTAPN